MTDGKRRRRRGKRGGQGRSGAGEGPQQARPEPRASDGEETEPSAPRRGARRDTRRSKTGGVGATPSTNGGGAIRRAPSAGESGRRPREGGRDGGGRQRRESSTRLLEPPPPPDPVSLELGQAFRDAHEAVRDARKVLEKRKAEFGDEPDWMLAQLEEAERRFAEAADRWVEHLAKTGRRSVRR